MLLRVVHAVLQRAPPGPLEHRDDLFRSPLAFIDTSALEWAKRRDQPGGDKEGLNQRGYRNRGEAEPLADLATYHCSSQGMRASGTPQAEYETHYSHRPHRTLQQNPPAGRSHPARDKRECPCAAARSARPPDA
jgi:hypothetical protein